MTMYVIEEIKIRWADQIIKFTIERPPTLSLSINNEMKEKRNAPSILPAA